MINIVLVEPEIPQNTGNIARTCAALGASLHLIEPLGFSVEDKYLKRAGLDYWDLLDVRYYSSFKDFEDKNKNCRTVFVTTKADRLYTEIEYGENCCIVFGKETRGLPEELLAVNHSSCVRIPMVRDARSLNLSNAAAIVAFEAARQLGFPGLKKYGELHRLKWES